MKKLSKAVIRMSTILLALVGFLLSILFQARTSEANIQIFGNRLKVIQMESLKPREKSSTVQFPKNIFMYWDRGAEFVPIRLRICQKTWKKLNPEWKFRFLTDNTLKQFIDRKNLKTIFAVPVKANRADLIRLHLLKTYGGVWADADVCATMSLDSWLIPYFGEDRDQFFAFRLPTFYDRSVISWFLASTPNSTISSIWYDSLVKHVNKYGHFKEYLQMHYQFGKLLAENRRFNSAESRMRPKFYGAWPNCNPPLHGRSSSSLKPVGGTPLLVESELVNEPQIVIPKIELPVRIVSVRHLRRDTKEASALKALLDQNIIPLLKLTSHARINSEIMNVICSHSLQKNCDEEI